LATALGAWAQAHPDSTLAAQETAVLTAVRTALPALVGAVLQTTQRSLQPAAPPALCPHCHTRTTVRDWRPRQVQTLCGRVRFVRPWAACPRCGMGSSVTDATLGLQPYQARSVGLTAVLVALGGACAFREAARLLQQTTGLAVSAETVRQVTQQAGAQHAAVEQAQTDAYRAGQEPVVTDPAPGVLVAETDGVMVPYRDGWHEVKVGLVGGWAVARGGAWRLQQVSYVAAREESGSFAWRWGAEAARRGAVTVIGWRGVHQGVAILRPGVILGDGAKWIWEAAASQFGERTEIVDYFHACEHLTTVAGALHGMGTPAASAWAATQRAAVLQGGVAAVLPQLAAPVGLAAAAAATLQTERRYFTTNAARMQYPDFRAQGLPIGSGAVESSAKHVIQQRLKRAGARWSDAGAAAMIALRAHLATTNGSAA
jgi:hypothetical protein